MKATSSRSIFSSPLFLPPLVPAPVRSYTELKQQIHHDLRVQHPEWIERNGDSPICDSYERRLSELIDLFQSSEPNLIAA